MRSSRFLILPLVAVLMCFSTSTTIADDGAFRGHLIVEMGRKVVGIPVHNLCPVLNPESKTGKLVATVLDGRFLFESGTKKVTIEASKLTKVVLPAIRSPLRHTHGWIQIEGDGVCKIKIGNASQDDIRVVANSQRQAGVWDVFEGSGWLGFIYNGRDIEEVLKENSAKGGSRTRALTSPPARTGRLTVWREPIDGKAPIKLYSGTCSRAWMPRYLAETNDSFGQALWNIPNPRRAGYSLKGEGSNSEDPSSLLCPPAAPGSSYENDGVYRRKWGQTAWKVPDHCTTAIAREPFGAQEIQGSCCCNTSGIILGGGVCKWVDSTDLGGWPNSPTAKCQ